jgi:hypothetical protein
MNYRFAYAGAEWRGVSGTIKRKVSTMPIVAECPKCGFKGNVPDQFKGKKVKCRQCANMFQVGGPSDDPSVNGTGAARKSNPELAEMEVVEEAAPRKVRPSAQGTAKPAEESDSSAFANFGDEPAAPRRPRKGSSQGTPASRKPAGGPRGPFKRKEQEPASPVVIVLGVLALLLGGSTLIISKPEMELIGLVGVPLGGLGLLLAVGGVVMAWGKPGFRIFVPILGLLATLGALPMAGWNTKTLIESGALSSKNKDKTTAGDSRAVAQAPTQNPDEPPPLVPNQPTDPKVDTPKKDTGSAPKTDPKRPAINEEVDASRGGSAQIGPVRVKVTGVEIDNGKRLLLIRLELENTGDINVNHFGWGAGESNDPDEAPRLRDNVQTMYAHKVLDRGDFKDASAGDTLQAKKTYKDMVGFELPTDKVLFVQLELPASYMEVQNQGKLMSKFRFKIPKSMLTGKGPLPPAGKEEPKPAEDAQKVIAEQLKILKEAKGQIDRVGALNTLGGLKEAGAPAAPDIAEYLAVAKEKNENVRAAAAKALGDIGPAAKAQIPKLIAALKDEFFKVKANAATALGRMGPDAKDALPELQKLTTSKDEEVPEAARIAIGRIKAGKVDPKGKK